MSFGVHASTPHTARSEIAMTTVPAPNDGAEAPLFADGIGERVVVADSGTGELLQVLRLRSTLTAVPSFEFALRERAARLANFRHAYYARVRRIDRIASPGAGLAIVSDHVEGTRLSDLLRVAHERGLQLDVNTALCLIRQLVPAVALLHENAREVAHGLIAPERLLVTPHARLVVVEHVLAAAIEQLQFGRERLWQEFRAALPPSAGLPRCDHRGDVTGMGLVALALLLGRPLEADEFPHRIPELLNQARERTALGDEQPLSMPLRTWLARALQLDPRRAFASAPEANAALEAVVADASTYVSAPVALETFLSRYTAALLEPAPAAVTQVLTPPPAPVLPPAAPVLADTPGFGTATPVESPTVLADTPRFGTVTPLESPPSDTPAGAGDHAKSRQADSRFPDFTEFRVELERDASMAKTSPVRHATQHMPPARCEPPSRVLRDATRRELTDAASREGWQKPPAPLFPPDLHEALAAPWIEPAAPSAPDAPAPSTSGAVAFPSAAGAPKMDVHVPAAEFAAVTARDIDEMISTADLIEQGTEQADAMPESVEDAPRARRSPWLRTAALLIAILALAGGGIFASRYYGTRAIPAAPTMGTILVQSRPAGVQVVVDGIDRGMTPARVSVTPGAHILELRGRGVPRDIPINIAAGAQVSHYIEFADAPATGQLSVQSQPPGARVLIDGVERGVAPLTVGDLSPGDHEVVFQSDAGNIRHVVTVQAGATASLVAPLAAPGPVSGWLAVKAPFTIEIREQGRMLGTSDTERIMIAAGRHELELVNDTLAYRATRVVQVPAGKVVPLVVDLPKGVVHLNALPWAEVWIDGARVGETPIGNLAVPIGPHEVVFRHPQFGEKRHAISVTLDAPVRVSVDMR